MAKRIFEVWSRALQIKCIQDFITDKGKDTISWKTPYIFRKVGGAIFQRMKEFLVICNRPGLEEESNFF